METIKCPYCECKVRMSDVEIDDGTCPECGAPLLGSLIMSDLGADEEDEDLLGLEDDETSEELDDEDE